MFADKQMPLWGLEGKSQRGEVSLLPHRNTGFRRGSFATEVDFNSTSGLFLDSLGRAFRDPTAH